MEILSKPASFRRSIFHKYPSPNDCAQSFQHLIIKVCTPSETRLTAEFFKTAILSASKSPGLASMVNSSKTEQVQVFSQDHPITPPVVEADRAVGVPPPM